MDLGWLRGPHAIEVRVTDERGLLKEGVGVWLTGPLDLGEERYGDELLGGWIQLTGSSDRAGRVVFSGLEEGKYHLSVRELDDAHEAVEAVPPVQFPSAGVRTLREIRVRPRRAGNGPVEERCTSRIAMPDRVYLLAFRTASSSSSTSLRGTPGMPWSRSRPRSSSAPSMSFARKRSLARSQRSIADVSSTARMRSR